MVLIQKLITLLYGIISITDMCFVIIDFLTDLKYTNYLILYTAKYRNKLFIINLIFPTNLK